MNNAATLHPLDADALLCDLCDHPAHPGQRDPRWARLWADLCDLWPDFCSAPAVRAGYLADECTLVDGFGLAWGLDSTVPYTLPTPEQYAQDPGSWDERADLQYGDDEVVL